MADMEMLAHFCPRQAPRSRGTHRKPAGLSLCQAKLELIATVQAIPTQTAREVERICFHVTQAWKRHSGGARRAYVLAKTNIQLFQMAKIATHLLSLSVDKLLLIAMWHIRSNGSIQELCQVDKNQPCFTERNGGHLVTSN